MCKLKQWYWLLSVFWTTHVGFANDVWGAIYWSHQTKPSQRPHTNSQNRPLNRHSEEFTQLYVHKDRKKIEALFRKAAIMLSDKVYKEDTDDAVIYYKNLFRLFIGFDNYKRELNNHLNQIVVHQKHQSARGSLEKTRQEQKTYTNLINGKELPGTQFLRILHPAELWSFSAHKNGRTLLVGSLAEITNATAKSAFPLPQITTMHNQGKLEGVPLYNADHAIHSKEYYLLAQSFGRSYYQLSELLNEKKNELFFIW